MQNASDAYRQSIEHGMYRNNGYIKVSLGVINQLAQEKAAVNRSSLFYFSSGDIFSGDLPSQLYATCEQNFSKVDGTMYFAPEQGASSYYNQGAVSVSLSGKITIQFGGVTDLDIKGFTIDFSDSFPTSFTITTNEVENTYQNNSRYFSTEDVFDGTDYIRIKANSMVNGQGRLRILAFTCGIANTFTNSEVINFTSKEYVSPICDSLPSMDMSITIDNQNQYYNPDNPESALSYMEVGQIMTIQFGYDSEGTGTIEWLPAQIAHLKSWSATDFDAKFTAVDKFDYLLNGNYYKGQYYPSGRSLYNLALDVLTDAGITDSSQYYLDDYLKDLTVKNPLPNVRYSECLQIIANAARCSLYIDREDRIHIAGNFIPDAVASTPTGQTDYSHVHWITNGEAKVGYGNASQDFSLLSDELYFAPDNVHELLPPGDYLNTGFVSSQVANANGTFTTNPVILIDMEAEYQYYGFTLEFRNVAPKNFTLQFYNANTLVDTRNVSGNTSLTWSDEEQSVKFDKLMITFTKGAPNSRIFVDNAVFGDATDYTVYRANLTGSPTATRQNRIQSISVVTQSYSNSTEALKSLKSETINKRSGETITKVLEFSNPSYGYTVSVKSSSGGGYSISSNPSGAYYLTLTISGAATMIQYEVKGYEYVVTDSNVTNTYHASGDIITWSNPLIDDIDMAKDVADWLGDYYLGDVLYQIPWRGDPRVDANDLFWLELKQDKLSLIRAYQNELAFNGGWSGTLQARNYRNTYKSKPIEVEPNGVLLTFSDPAVTESASFDYLRIFYQPEGETGYRGTSKIGGTFSGLQVFVPAFKVWVYWITDSSVTRSGWAITKVKAQYSEESDFPDTWTSLPIPVTDYISGTSELPSALNYGNNERKLWEWDLTSLKG